MAREKRGGRSRAASSSAPLVSAKPGLVARKEARKDLRVSSTLLSEAKSVQSGAAYGEEGGDRGGLKPIELGLSRLLLCRRCRAGLCFRESSVSRAIERKERERRERVVGDDDGLRREGRRTGELHQFELWKASARFPLLSFNHLNLHFCSHVRLGKAAIASLPGTIGISPRSKTPTVGSLRTSTPRPEERTSRRWLPPRVWNRTFISRYSWKVRLMLLRHAITGHERSSVSHRIVGSLSSGLNRKDEAHLFLPSPSLSLPFHQTRSRSTRCGRTRIHDPGGYWYVVSSIPSFLRQLLLLLSALHLASSSPLDYFPSSY